jgi:hypothetical protein
MIDTQSAASIKQSARPIHAQFPSRHERRLTERLFDSRFCGVCALPHAKASLPDVAAERLPSHLNAAIPVLEMVGSYRDIESATNPSCLEPPRGFEPSDLRIMDAWPTPIPGATPARGSLFPHQDAPELE